MASWLLHSRNKHKQFAPRQLNGGRTTPDSPVTNPIGHRKSLQLECTATDLAENTGTATATCTVDPPTAVLRGAPDPHPSGQASCPAGPAFFNASLPPGCCEGVSRLFVPLARRDGENARTRVKRQIHFLSPEVRLFWAGRQSRRSPHHFLLQGWDS